MKRHLSAVLVAATLAVTAAACGPRQVEVTTGAQPAVAELGLRVTNNLSQGVNVYIVSGGSDMFLRQVGANSTETLSVRGVASGSTVTLRATTVDGSRTYTKDNVVLSGTYVWQLP